MSSEVVWGPAVPCSVIGRTKPQRWRPFKSLPPWELLQMENCHSKCPGRSGSD